jgi:hypothetical protein
MSEQLVAEKHKNRSGPVEAVSDGTERAYAKKTELLTQINYF